MARSKKILSAGKSSKAKTTNFAWAVALKNAANILGAAAPSIVNNKGKTYEAWILFRIASELKKSEVKVIACTHSGRKTKSFRLRGAPGYLRPARPHRLPQPCYFNLNKSGFKSYELHNSIEHVGRSGTTHELDVSVIARDFANLARAKPNGGAYSGPRLVGIELKDFDQSTSLDLAIARAFLGVVIDLESFLMHPAHPPSYSLLTTASVSQTATELLGHYGLDAWDQVKPGGQTMPITNISVRILSWL